MPFMQRIDEYGIALHGGNNPGYPASHGCVRMPMKFAEKLFGFTKLGTEVIIEG
jgi:lipoprotein-anchoring transpeptidase ErfK/SrfK